MALAVERGAGRDRVRGHHGEQAQGHDAPVDLQRLHALSPSSFRSRDIFQMVDALGGRGWTRTRSARYGGVETRPSRLSEGRLVCPRGRTIVRFRRTASGYDFLCGIAVRMICRKRAFSLFRVFRASV